MSKLRSLLLALPVILALAVVTAYADVETSSDTATVGVYVQPQVVVTLTADPTYYDFGILPVNTSSNSATSVDLRNDGDVGVTLQSQVISIVSDAASEDEWEIAESTGLNTFTLYHAADDDMDNLGDYKDGHKLSDTVMRDLNKLDGSTQAEIDFGQMVESWFRIDMPTAVEDTFQRTITVEVLATSR